MSAEKRSRLMSRIRGKDTTPERYVAILLAATGIKHERHRNDLPGRPDFSFPQARLAVFINGDFWHGWRFPLWRHRLAPRWQEKIETNRARDRRNKQRLRRMDWMPLTIWEHSVESDPIDCIRRIAEALGRKRVAWTKVRSAYEQLPPLKRRPRLPKP